MYQGEEFCDDYITTENVSGPRRPPPLRSFSPPRAAVKTLKTLTPMASRVTDRHKFDNLLNMSLADFSNRARVSFNAVSASQYSKKKPPEMFSLALKPIPITIELVWSLPTEAVGMVISELVRLYGSWTMSKFNMADTARRCCPWGTTHHGTKFEF